MEEKHHGPENVHAKGKDPKDQRPKNKNDKYTKQVRQTSTKSRAKKGGQRASVHVEVHIPILTTLGNTHPIRRSNEGVLGRQRDTQIQDRINMVHDSTCTSRQISRQPECGEMATLFTQVTRVDSEAGKDDLSVIRWQNLTTRHDLGDKAGQQVDVKSTFLQTKSQERKGDCLMKRSYQTVREVVNFPMVAKVEMNNAISFSIRTLHELSFKGFAHPMADSSSE